MLNFLGENHVN